MTEEPNSLNSSNSSEVAKAAADEHDRKRHYLAKEMGEIFGAVMPRWGGLYGIELTINALLDIVVGLICTSFPREHIATHLKKVMLRIAETDVDRHIARFNQGKLSVVNKERRSESGIILPK